MAVVCNTLLIRDGNLIIRDGGLVLCEVAAPSVGAAIGAGFRMREDFSDRKKDVDVVVALLILADE